MQMEFCEGTKLTLGIDGEISSKIIPCVLPEDEAEVNEN
jgi:hypothetical protein